jgi:hypothetical protein
MEGYWKDQGGISSNYLGEKPWGVVVGLDLLLPLLLLWWQPWIT